MLSTLSLATLIIAYDPGGVVSEYEAKAKMVLETQTRVEIIGDCYSACTLFADRARPNVCVTPDTRFYIHQATEVSTGRRSPVEYSPDLQSYIGEQPTDGWLLLTYDDLTNFWSTCK
ncbi:hypothetical protein [Mesorhizobium sp.]|uniref:hypothetical protein n=1 Tax=Mesorhizobium sp. TaxID=1871066 RepID=UPI000FE9450E|nr:hypothetical protein [Mesorhizobium sp.]RWD43898.1 MAG: hypothetical protein EOS35_18635 [Mesorhizobium sp.]TIU09975.1 MAG: hypothetical protein E5W39_01715 [Mesorhizobium sp.]